MKFNEGITINGQRYSRGKDVSWYLIYPFFLVHMLAFGASGFFMAYSHNGPPVQFLYMHGGLAIIVYTIFYLSIFGIDEVKWMFINAGLGFFGIYSEIGWLLSLFGKQVSDYPVYVHVVPFLYYILYTFLVRQAVLDLMRARRDETRRRTANGIYVTVSLVIYVIFFFLQTR